MKQRFEVLVSLKEGLADPQGKAIEDALPSMGWTSVSEVRVGKHIELTVDADTEDGALRVANQVAERLLANPVIEDFRVISQAEIT
ncbi:MAG TPA: phosphoribosylformylglycinamidine synthase subunit PurS [Actinomycetota bacterium]|nr:phosphoribosylformylglycinamidine synthase subunit PurS [Actinomycetota bacterium]